MYQQTTLSAGVAVEFQEAADFVRILEATPVDLQLIFYAAGKEIARADNIGEGYAEKVAGGFDKIRMTSASGGLVEFVMRLGGDVRYDKPPTGSIVIVTATTLANTAAVSVGTAATALVAASASRKRVVFYNAGTADVWLGAAGITTATGALKIAAGETWVETDAPGAAWFGVSGTAAQSVRIQEAS